MEEAIKKHIEDSLKALNLLKNKHRRIEIVKAAEYLWATIRSGEKILLCGNGGSAADIQHLSAELIGRFRYSRLPYPAVALSSDTAAMTAIANDYGFDHVFSRQVLALGKLGDMLIAVSTSGNSENVKKALLTAKRLGMRTLVFTGQNNNLDAYAHLVIKAPSKVTAEIQECHKMMFHAICAGLDELEERKT